MYKFRGVAVTISILLFTTFSSAFAQDELSAAWDTYTRSRAELMSASDKVDNAWDQVTNGWIEIDRMWDQLDYSWHIVNRGWTEVDAARVIVSRDLNITLEDRSPRLTRNSNPRTRSQTIFRTQEIPTPLDYTQGSWSSLSHSWDSLDTAWIPVDQNWKRLESAWAELSLAHDEVAHSWIYIDQAFQQTSLAFDDIDRAWNPH